MTVVTNLGWVLLHFVWQGAAIAAALWVALLLTPPRRASARYALGCTALLLMVVAPVATAMRVMHASAPPPTAMMASRHVEPAGAQLAGADVARATAHLAAVLFDAPAGTTTTDRTMWIRGNVDAALPWLVTAWAFGVVVLSVRLMGGWWHTHRLRSRALVPVPPLCLEAVSRLTARVGIRRPVAVAVSLSVSAPLVLGHLKPLVLLPAAAVSGLTPMQLEAILAHELGHVRRHDYLVNLAQTVIETVLFYHPAVWWVSRQVRAAREHCCDDLAVTACGNRKGYVEALLGLEQLRRSSPLFALGATDGSLLARARRVLVDADRDQTSPRLAAGAIALTIAAFAIAGVSTASPESNTFPAAREVNQSSVPPVRIIAAPSPLGTLAERWTWAEREARSGRTKRYWIGYSIQPLRGLPPVLYLDRTVAIIGDGMTFRGHLLGSGDGLVFPGRRLDLADADAGSLKLMLAFDVGGDNVRLTRVHASNATLPMDVTDLPVYWLGAADTSQSLERVDGLYARTPSADVRKDLIAVAGVHDDSARVVSWLEQRIASSDADEIRAEATEWLAWHPIEAALRALDRIARSDRSSRVRQEAAEAMGDLNMPEATEALIGLARTLPDTDARREAVEALGARPDLSARDALGAIASEDPSSDIKREAVETLGDYPDQRGVPLLLDIARTHAEGDVRREAIETLGDALPGDAAVPLLRKMALEDTDPDVQREAVDALSGIDEKESGTTLMELAQSHPNREMRRSAIEALAQADSEPSAAVVELLSRLAASDPDRDVQLEAVETLGEVRDPNGLEQVRELARTHADAGVRREALETVVEHTSPDVALKVLRHAIENDKDAGVRIDAVERLAQIDDGRARDTLLQLARSHEDLDVQVEAVETLADLADGQGIPGLIEIARTHADSHVRKRALEALVESDHPEARKLFERALRKDDRQ